MLGRLVNEALLERGWGHAWGDLAPVQWVRLLPVRIDHRQVNRATGPDRSWFLDRLKRLCGELGTALVPDADGTVAVTSAPRLLPHLGVSRDA